ncbi:MAG: ABC transporter ATP-binding protein [Actinobacteria bacterium]|nr:ABC transporter ATP-binding protein [Actinomycetota bacterium]
MPESALLSVASLRKVFKVRGARGARRVAVDEVSFTLEAGGSLAIVGESGSGKTTVARMIVGLETPTGGAIDVCGRSRTQPPRSVAERRRRGREAQIVFQEPYQSLDPRQRVGAAIDEVLRCHLDIGRRERREKVAALLDDVGLQRGHVDALPRELSGGQLQRVTIARALAVSPRLLVLDEAVSALDVSVQAQIVNLLAEIRERHGTSYLFISHDLAVVRHVSERTLVMRSGRVVEQGPTDRILDSPEHSYTQLLRASVPGPGWRPSRRPTAAQAR